MKEKALIACLITILFCFSAVSAQEKKVNMYDSAQVYYKKKDFKQASRFFDIYYIEQQNSQSNYDTYFAAVSAAHVGNLERAKYYLKQSAAIGYDVTNYSFFADDPNNIPLRGLGEWKKFVNDFKVKSDSAKTVFDKITAEINDTTIRAEASLLDNPSYWSNIASKSTAEQLVKKIKQFNDFKPIKKENFWTFYQIRANDTLNAPFMVHIPKNYHPNERTPLYVYLHGAVISKPSFTKPEYIPNGQESKAMSQQIPQNSLIIYPLGKKDFGWLYQQQAFETIIREISFIKSRYNIDDDKIYVGGHSNGGSGAFWFAINQPTSFASFFGFNYLPKAYFGNTALKNLNNITPFYGVSASEDTTFPLVTVNSIYQFGIQNGANWTSFVRKGNHSLPFANPDSVKVIFDTLSTKTRNPFSKKISWETDNIRNGRNSWLEIIELDTLATNASWHQPLNPQVTQAGRTAEVNFNKNKSGAVKAIADGNTIWIETSRVKRIKLYISSDMFNLNEQIKLVINGKKYLNFRLEADKKVILEEFLKTKDRSFVVSNVIELTTD